MSSQPVKSVTPFDFRSDFEQQSTEPDKISLTVAELAGLLDDARRTTADMLRNEQVQQQADAMRASSEALKTSLAQIVQLAELLETASFSDEIRDEALTRVRALAAELIDGQGNLFHP